MLSFYRKYKEYVTNSLYPESEGNAGLAKRIFKGKDFLEEKVKITITRQTILRWWKLNGFRTNPRGGYRHGIPEKIFRKAHNKSRGDVNKIERYFRRFGINRESIKGRCRQYELPYY
jgi:hypothetical protein